MKDFHTRQFDPTVNLVIITPPHHSSQVTDSQVDTTTKHQNCQTIHPISSLKMPTILPSNHTSPGHKPNSTPASLAIPQDTHHSNHTVSDGPSNRVDLINSEHGRILCIADIRGRLSQINELAAEFNAIAVIHSGDFGFYGQSYSNPSPNSCLFTSICF